MTLFYSNPPTFSDFVKDCEIGYFNTPFTCSIGQLEMQFWLNDTLHSTLTTSHDNIVLQYSDLSSTVYKWHDTVRNHVYDLTALVDVYRSHGYKIFILARKFSPNLSMFKSQMHKALPNKAKTTQSYLYVRFEKYNAHSVPFMTTIYADCHGVTVVKGTDFEITTWADLTDTRFFGIINEARMLALHPHVITRTDKPW